MPSYVPFYVSLCVFLCVFLFAFVFLRLVSLVGYPCGFHLIKLEWQYDRRFPSLIQITEFIIHKRINEFAQILICLERIFCPM